MNTSAFALRDRVCPTRDQTIQAQYLKRSPGVMTKRSLSEGENIGDLSGRFIADLQLLETSRRSHRFILYHRRKIGKIKRGLSQGKVIALLTLGVNIDHVATIRQARKTVEPDPIAAAMLAELAGADGITAHLREDRRHIQDRDIYLLRQTVRTHLNLEMAATEEMLAIALDVKPDYVTLVPERREEVTTEGGLDIIGGGDRLHRIVEQLQSAGIPVSLFIDADPAQIKASARIQAQFIELHTGKYADAPQEATRHQEWEHLRQGTTLAIELGLRVNAGHGLTYGNVHPVATIPGMEELNIGHSIISRSVLVGLERAVREMKQALRGEL